MAISLNHTIKTEELIVQSIVSLQQGDEKETSQKSQQLFNELLSNKEYKLNINRIFRFSSEIQLDDLYESYNKIVDKYLTQEMMRYVNNDQLDVQEQNQINQQFKLVQQQSQETIQRFVDMKNYAISQIKTLVLTQVRLRYQVILDTLIQIKRATGLLERLDTSTVIEKKHRQKLFMEASTGIEISYFKDIKNRFSKFDEDNGLLRQEFRHNMGNHKLFKMYETKFLQCYSENEFLQQLFETFLEEVINDVSYRNMQLLINIQVFSFHIAKYFIYFMDVIPDIQTANQEQSREQIVNKIIQQLLQMIKQGCIFIQEFLKTQNILSSIEDVIAIKCSIDSLKKIQLILQNDDEIIQGMFNQIDILIQQLLPLSIERLDIFNAYDDLISETMYVHVIPLTEVNQINLKYDKEVMESELNKISDADTEDGNKIGKFLQRFTYNGSLIMLQYVTLDQNNPVLQIDTQIDVLNLYTQKQLQEVIQQKNNNYNINQSLYINVKHQISHQFKYLVQFVIICASLCKRPYNVMLISEQLQQCLYNQLYKDKSSQCNIQQLNMIRSQSLFIKNIKILNKMCLLLSIFDEINGKIRGLETELNIYDISYELFKLIMQNHITIQLIRDDNINLTYNKDNFIVTKQIKYVTTTLMKLCNDIGTICPLIASPLQKQLAEQFVLQILKYYSGFENSLVKSKSSFLATTLKHVFQPDQPQKNILKITKTSIYNIQTEVEYLTTSLNIIYPASDVYQNLLDNFKKAFTSAQSVMKLVDLIEKVNLCQEQTLTQLVLLIQKQFIGNKSNQKQLQDYVASRFKVD